MEQGSPEWFAARAGKVTASRVSDIVTRTKSGYAASRANYMAELLCERLTGQPAPSFQSPAMAWGTANEPVARQRFVEVFGMPVEEVGFVPHATIANTGASPDGLIQHDGLIEIKCPQTSTHLEILSGGKIPARYMFQMYWQMACTGRDWCMFVCFDPRLPEAMQLYTEEVPRDEKIIAELEEEVIKFIEELNHKVMVIKSKYGVTENV